MQYHQQQIVHSFMAIKFLISEFLISDINDINDICFWESTNPHWARVVGYGPFSLWVIHKKGLCLSSGDNNRLMMMMIFWNV
jgi:hypothetical protein